MDEPLQKFIVLVPLCFNDGTPVPDSVILEFQEKLFILGGGYSIASTIEGAYRMSDGKKQIDHSIQYWIGVPQSQADELRTIVGELGKTLGQEKMYLEHTGSWIDLVPPSSKGGEQ